MDLGSLNSHVQYVSYACLLDPLHLAGESSTINWYTEPLAIASGCKGNAELKALEQCADLGS